MYSKKAQKELVSFLKKLKGEENIDSLVFSLFKEEDISVLTAVDIDTGVSFFVALIDLGFYWLIDNALHFLCLNWTSNPKVRKRFLIAFRRDKNGDYPLDYALNLSKDNPNREKIIKLILTHSEKIGFSAINKNIVADDLEELKKNCLIFEEFKLQNRRKIKIPWNKMNPEGKSFLMVAAEFDAINCAKFLIEEIGVKVDIKNKEGETALDIARMMGNTEVVEYLERQKKREGKNVR